MAWMFAKERSTAAAKPALGEQTKLPCARSRCIQAESGNGGKHAQPVEATGTSGCQKLAEAV